MLAPAVKWLILSITVHLQPDDILGDRDRARHDGVYSGTQILGDYCEKVSVRLTIWVLVLTANTLLEVTSSFLSGPVTYGFSCNRRTDVRHRLGPGRYICHALEDARSCVQLGEVASKAESHGGIAQRWYNLHSLP